MWKKKTHSLGYDPEVKEPVLRCSICTGEQVAGFRDLHNGHFEEDMYIGNDHDLRTFCQK